MSGLQVSGVSYSYGAREALKNVSLKVPQGTFCALLGPNGAGKSTLFNLLTRLFTAPSGEITIAGHDLKQTPRAALSCLGTVFQQPTLDLDLSVRQNLKYFAALHGLSGAQARARIDTNLERLNMLERAEEKVRSLNGGHRRRAEIARALVPEPKVLLLDEPTVGLDSATRLAITEHVHTLASQGTTVLWTTHLTDEVRPDDHLVILHKAQVLKEGTARDICGDMPLQQRFMQLTGEQAV
jgi:ABC-2 type transport system ATP-binding protein